MPIDASAMKLLNKIVERAQIDVENGLKHASLDKNAVRLAVFSDASFVTNHDLMFQPDFRIVLAN